MMGVGWVLPDLGAVVEAGGWRGQMMVGGGEDWALVQAGTVGQTGAGVEKGVVLRVLGSGPEESLQVSVAWGDPPSAE